MAEQRLIDANKLIEKCENLYMRGHVLFHGVTAFTIENAPTIDPETLPIVHQLRAELALITHQRDVYKSVFERITAHCDCNDCEKCAHYRVPWNGCTPDYECPLSDRCLNRDMWKWRGPRKEE